MSADYSCIPKAALTALAALVLKRTRLSLPNNTRGQAVAIILGVKPAPPRNSPSGITVRAALCVVCRGPIPSGTLCDPTGRMHIKCSGAR